MPIKYLDEDPERCRVEFQLSADAGAQQAWIVGEFNDWSTEADPMQVGVDGSLSVVLWLDRGRSYRYRYYLGEQRWENDWAADRYVDNDFGGADSVVDVPPAASNGHMPDAAIAAGPTVEREPVDDAARDEEAAALAAAPPKKAAAKKAATKKAPAKKSSAKKAPAKKKAD